MSRQFTSSHEWVELDGDIATVGISDYAQDALGDIVFVTLPAVEDLVTVGKSFAEIESVKAVSEVFSPVSGTVTEVNFDLLDAPEKINEDAYGAWLMKVKFSATATLLSEAEYDALDKD